MPPRRLRRLARISVIGLLLALPAKLLAGGIVTVVQKGRMFDRTGIAVRTGDTVRFSNEDVFLHQMYVESAQFTFHSDEQATGTAVDIRFPVSGVFEVRCEIHPKMRLRVEVQ